MESRASWFTPPNYSQPHTWALLVLPEDRNLDQLPEALLPSAGCELCGGAYVELDAVAVDNLPMLAVLDDGFRVRAGTDTSYRPAAVRLLCCEGHETVQVARSSFLSLALMGAYALLGLGHHFMRKSSDQ